MEAPIPPQFNVSDPVQNSNQPFPAPKKSDPWGKIIGINLLILLIYSAAAFIYGWEDAAGFQIAAYLGHAVALLIISIGRIVWTAGTERKSNAAAYFVSSFLILIIGFATCYYGFVALDNNLGI